MSRKMLAEEKELRTMIRNHELKGQLLKATAALVRAVREDCIEAYRDWEGRPTKMEVTFPEALRGNMRWRKVAIRRGK
jgi:hypothetical protein